MICTFHRSQLSTVHGLVVSACKPCPAHWPLDDLSFMSSPFEPVGHFQIIHYTALPPPQSARWLHHGLTAPCPQSGKLADYRNWMEERRRLPLPEEPACRSTCPRPNMRTEQQQGMVSQLVHKLTCLPHALARLLPTLRFLICKRLCSLPLQFSCCNSASAVLLLQLGYCSSASATGLEYTAGTARLKDRTSQSQQMQFSRRCQEPGLQHS